MAVANLVNSVEDIVSGNDNVVIVNIIESIRGGRTLDVTGFTPEVIKAGHVIIRDTDSGEYKPMPLNSGGTAYAALPEDHEYAGILINTVRTKKPMAGILTRGTVNHKAAPYPMVAILAAVRAALPLIQFVED